MTVWSDRKASEFLCKLCKNGNLSLIHRFSVRELSEFIPKFNRTYRKDFTKDLRLTGDEVFFLVRCHVCAFSFIANPLSMKKLFKLYGKVIDPSVTKSISVQSDHRRFFLNIWLDILASLKHGEVLDIGCGWGEFLQIGRLFGFDCYGFELDQGKYARLKKQGIKMLKGLDKSDKRYDFILINQVLEHVVDPALLVRYCHLLLKDSGRLLVAVPDFSNLDLVLEKLNRGEEVTKTLNPLEHINYFTPQSLNKLLSNAKFVVQDYYPVRFENWRSPVGVTKEIAKMLLNSLVDYNIPSHTTFVICRVSSET